MRFIKKYIFKFGIWLSIRLINKNTRVKLDDTQMKEFKIKSIDETTKKSFCYKNRYILIIWGILLAIGLCSDEVIKQHRFESLLFSTPILLLSMFKNTKLDFDRANNSLIVSSASITENDYTPIYKIPLDIIKGCEIVRKSSSSKGKALRTIALILQLKHSEQEIINNINEWFSEFPELEEDKIKLLETYQKTNYNYEGIYCPFASASTSYSFYKKCANTINDFLAGKTDFASVKDTNTLPIVLAVIFTIFYLIGICSST